MLGSITKKLKRTLRILILAILAIIFFRYGRSIYIPLLYKIKGKENVESVIQKMERDVLNRIQTDFDIAGFKNYPHELIIVAFKEEQKLQIYGKDYIDKKFIKEYPFTAYSGDLGPKLKEGDKQIPEGIYKVEYLNPNSAYHLSIKINYPNEYDKSKTKLSNTGQMGGDIFIHGKSATIGCIPIGDKAIEEVFVMAQKAFKNEIKVIISPRDFRGIKKFPEIESIDWENDLYEKIKNELNTLPK